MLLLSRHRNILDCRVSARQPSPFCFGKRTQNHVGRDCGPSGSLRGSPTPAARKLARLKQCAPFLRCRLHCSATPQGQEETAETMSPLIIEGQLAEPALSFEGLRQARRE